MGPDDFHPGRERLDFMNSFFRYSHLGRCRGSPQGALCRRSLGRAGAQRRDHRRRQQHRGTDGQRAPRRRGRRRAGGRRGPVGVPGLVGDVDGRARRRADRDRRRSRGPHRRAGRADEPRGRHADQHVTPRPGRPGRRRLPLDRRGAGRLPPGGTARLVAGDPPARGRGRRDHAVELPALPAGREAGARAGRRLHDHPEAGRRRRRWPPSRWPRSSTLSACRRARSTSSAAPAARSAS